MRTVNLVLARSLLGALRRANKSFRLLESCRLLLGRPWLGFNGPGCFAVVIAHKADSTPMQGNVQGSRRDDEPVTNLQSWIYQQQQ